MKTPLIFIFVLLLSTITYSQTECVPDLFEYSKLDDGRVMLCTRDEIRLISDQKAFVFVEMFRFEEEQGSIYIIFTIPDECSKTSKLMISFIDGTDIFAETINEENCDGVFIFGFKKNSKASDAFFLADNYTHTMSIVNENMHHKFMLNVNDSNHFKRIAHCLLRN